MAEVFNNPPEKPVMSTEEASLLVEVLGRYESDRDFATPHFDRGKLNYNAYRFYVDPRSHPYKYNPVSPLCYTLCEDIVSTIVNAFFERPKLVDIVPVETHANPQFGGIDDVGVARQLERAVNLFYMDPESEFDNELMDFVKQACIYGNSYSTITPKFVKNSDGELVYAGPNLETRDYFDVIVNKQAYRMSKRRYLFLRENITYDELKRREKVERYRNVDRVRAEDFMPEDPHDEVFTALGNISRHFQTPDKDSNRVQLIHYFVGKHIITVANARFVVRNTMQPVSINGELLPLEPYPYDIWDGFTYSPVPKEFYGLSVVDLSKDYQDQNNLFKRMRYENIELGLHKVLVTDLTFDVDIDNLVFAPGNIIDAPAKSIDVLDVGDITQSSYTESGINKQEAQDAVGSQEISRGMRTGGRSTAAQNILLNRNAAKKSHMIVKRLNNSVFRNWVKKTIIQMRVYMTQPEYERLIGEQDAGLFTLSVDEIDRLFDIRPTSTSIDLLREQELSSYVQMFQAAAQMPQIINMREFAKYGFELFAPHINPERFVFSEEQIQAQQQQQQGVVPGASPTSTPTPGGSTLSNDQVLQGVLQGNFGA